MNVSRISTPWIRIARLVGAAAFAGSAAQAADKTWDFTSDPSGELTIAGSNDQPWRNTGGNPGGFLALTYSQNAQHAVVVFPNLDPGKPIAGFTFSADLRIGNPTGERAADGFSISLAREADPIFGDPGSLNLFAGGCCPETGTRTGVVVSFDTWSGNSFPNDPNDQTDIEGIIVRVDDVTVKKASLPTRNGGCDDLTSLQTGPRDAGYWNNGGDPRAAESWKTLCWKPFAINLTTDGKLTVSWKGNKVLDNFQITYLPTAGRLILAARTAGANQNTHFDNMKLTTTTSVPTGIVEIITSPQSVTTQSGQTATFAVDSRNSTSFQWFKDGYSLPGATNATLTFTNVQPPRIGDYRVVVSNGAGSVTSSVATLNIQGVDSGIWNGLVAYYPFNGSVENSIPDPTTDLTYSGPQLGADRFGRPSAAFEFNGSGYMKTKGAFGLTGNTPRTMSLWLYRRKMDRGGLVGWGSGDAGYGKSCTLFAEAGGRVLAGGFYADKKSTSEPLALNRWIHLTMTYVDSVAGIKLYIDGTEISSYVEQSLSNVWNTQPGYPLFIGSEAVSGGATFNGSIDDVRIYNRALSNVEVAALYASEVSQNRWDDVISYRNIYSDNALKYVVEQVNVSRVNEGRISYWNTDSGGAKLTQKFSFPSRVRSAYLRINYIYSWGGSGSIWGSRDGVNWILLLDAPSTGAPIGYHYDGNLPNEVLGEREIWIQARMSSRILQFLRYDLDRSDNAFELKVQYESEALSQVAILTQPESVVINLGETASFSVKATNATAFQWSKDGTALPGATNATLTFTNVQPPMIGDYRVVVSNGAGSVTSSVVALNINGVIRPPSFITEGLELHYTFSGAESYYGSKDLVFIEGHAPGYRGVYMNGLTSRIETHLTQAFINQSKNITVSAWVKADPALQRLDNWGVAMFDAGHGPVNTSGMEGRPFGLWLQPQFKERALYWTAYLANPSGKWRRVLNVLKPNEWNHITYVFDLSASPHRADMYVKGVKVDSFIPQFDAFQMLGNRVNIGLINTWNDVDSVKDGFWGTTPANFSSYRVYRRSLTDSEVAALYAYEAPQPPAISVQPEGRMVGLGETVSFGVTATGSAPLSYQWSKDGTALPGATNATLTFTNVQPPRIGDYRVVVSNGAGSVTSSVATLNIQGVDAGIWKGLVAYYPFDGNANDESGNGNNGNPNSVVVSNNRFGGVGMAYGFGGNGYVKLPNSLLNSIPNNDSFSVSAWFFYSAPVDSVNKCVFSLGVAAPNRMMTMFSQNRKLGYSQFGTQYDLITNAQLPIGQWKFGCLVYNRGAVSLFFEGVRLADRQVTIQAPFGNGFIGARPDLASSDSWIGSIDDVRFYNRALSDAEVAALYAYESTPPVPTVVTAPVDQTLVAGQTLSLTAQIAGSNLAYRWQKDGADLADGGRVAGAATPTLTITAVTPADAGQYRLTASNANGSAATAVATVSVRVPPSITQQPQSVDGIEGDAITLSVSVTGVPAPSFQWFKNGLVLEGQTAATLEFPVLKESDAGTYRVVVSNPAGSVTSTDAILTYTPAIRVLADGVPVREVVRTLLPVTVDLQFARDGWLVFYTLDGSEPTFASEAFLSPFVIGQAAILKTVAYSADFAQSVPGAPVAFRFLQPQTISWDAIPTLQYQQQGTVGVSASSGLPVVLSVVSGPATLSGNQLTATGVGDVVLRAVQAGSDAFASVTSERTLTVAKAQQTLTWPALASRTFGEAAFPVVVTASSGLPVTLAVTSGKATVSGSSVTLTGAGSVTLTATQSGDANRAEVSESKTFAAAKAEQTLTFPTVANRPYTPEPFAPAGTASSGLALAFEVLSGPAAVEAGKIRLTGVGSVVLRATQPGNADYNAALPVDRTFTVSQGTQTLTFAPVGAKTFGDAPVTLSATSSAGLAVTFRVLSGPGSVSGDVLTLSGAGTLVLQALQAGTDLYAAASASQTVVVAKAAQTLTFVALADTGYTTSALALAGSASSGLPVAFRVVSGPATVSGSELRLTGVGVVTVAADQAGDANHLAAPTVTRSFTVSRGTQEITFAPVGDQVLGNPAVTLSATSSSGLSVAFQVISGPATVSGNQLTLLNEGTVVVRARQVGSPLWLAAQVDQTFQIRKLTTLTLNAGVGGTITVDPLKERYDPKEGVTLSAVPAEGYRFEEWSGDLTGTANPTTLVMAANRTVGATFKDVAAPVLVWELPQAGTTGNEQAVLSGRVTDNAPGVTATWRRDGGAAEALPLAVDGSFRVEGLKLAPGANTFVVSAKDTAGNVASLERIVTWVPERILRVASAAEVQEGQRLVFPVQLVADAANVAGLTFRLTYDPAYLADPQVEWGALVGQSVNNVNVGTAGQISGSFALAGTALPAGTNPVATVSFRARSVPTALGAVVTPTLVSLSSPSGATLPTGNAVVSGEGRILPRKIKGDNNANQRIDVGDAVVISRLEVGLEERRSWDVALNDLNTSGAIDSGDVVRALRVVVGLDPQPKAAPRSGGLSVESGVLRGEGAAGAEVQEGVGPGVEWALSRPVLQGTAAPTGLRPVASGRGSLRPAGSNTNDVATLEFPDGPVAQVGKPYRVVVKLTRASAAISGLSFTVSYPSVLTLTDKQVGALVPADALPLWAESVGSVNLAAVRSTIWPTSTGVASVLTFLPTAGISAQSTWPIELVKAEVTGAGFDIRALDNVTGEIRSTSTPPVEPKVVVPTLPSDGGPLALDIEAGVGAAIVLETTTDLGSWSEAQRLTGQGAGKPVRVTVTPDPNARVRFWRVRVP